YSGYLADGKMFDSSVQRGEPIKFELGIGMVIPGWEEGIALMKKGDKCRLIIPYNLAYGEQGRPPVIPQKADLVFDVELIEIYPEIKVEPFNIKGKKEYSTESGLKYYIVKENEGEKIGPDATVKVHYTGYLDDGSIFDSSVKRESPFSFPFGKSRVIKGWEEGIALMKTGEKFRLIIPANLAYGEKGFPPVIPANATLTFDIELLEISK
ncbi:MAG: FKBP-type peptidyl-prolyl cis-trans isomerase, partial [Bacteroidota bacterium]